jgi:hypothetical protein
MAGTPQRVWHPFLNFVTTLATNPFILHPF